MIKELIVIGRAERADLLDLQASDVPVKIDTGADTSSIWAHATDIADGRLHVIFFGKESAFYTGQEHVFGSQEYSVTRVANSFGQSEIRYKVRLRIRIKGKLINGTFTLSDRSKKLYPVLVGRSLLKNKFVVDVAKGDPLAAAEKARAKKLKNEMEVVNGKVEL